jgi:hypothetical protein
MLRYLCAIGIWLAAPLVIFALPFDAPFPTCIAMLYLYAGGPLLALAFVILLFATRKKPPAVTALMLVLSLLLPIWFYGFTFGMRVHLFVNEGRYAERIRELSQAKSAEEKKRICGDECAPHSERPLVIFHTCHCPFFWPDLVYDPSGALRDKDELRKLDQYLMDSRHLTTFWYIGYFGD